MMTFLNWIQSLPLSTFVRESGSIWAFPMFLFAHTAGLSLVAGGSAMIDLALLGLWPKTPIKPLARLYPMIWFGFWLNAATGVSMLMANAVNTALLPDFWIKMGFVFFGMVLAVKMRTHVFAAPGLDREPVTSKMKMLAWASLVCWFGAIIAGRLIAYVGRG